MGSWGAELGQLCGNGGQLRGQARFRVLELLTAAHALHSWVRGANRYNTFINTNNRLTTWPLALAHSRALSSALCSLVLSLGPLSVPDFVPLVATPIEDTWRYWGICHAREEKRRNEQGGARQCRLCVKVVTELSATDCMTFFTTRTRTVLYRRRRIRRPVAASSGSICIPPISARSERCPLGLRGLSSAPLRS